MKFKKVVAISMITASSLLALILVIGLLVPESVLLKLSKHPAGGTEATQVTTTADGKKVVETVNPATGEKVVTVTDPKTGQSVTTTTASDGSQTTTTGAASSGSSSGGSSTGGTGTGGSTGGGSAGGGSTGGGSTGGGSTGGGTTTPDKPVVSISVSPSTITSGSSATLGWSATNSPSSCTASGGWSGSKAASGTQSVSPTSSTSYTLDCSNAGGSGSATASITVNAPAPGCGQGGTCHLSDIQSHNTSGDCRSAINKSGAGLAAYAIPSSFLSTHQPKKSITSTLCGKVYGSNLRNVTSEHRGPTLGGSTYDTWMSNFYIGPYN